MAGYDEIFHFTPRTSPAFGLADRQGAWLLGSVITGDMGTSTAQPFF